MLLLLLLAAAWSYGQGQVVLKQSKASITREEKKTAYLECTVEGVSNFQAEYIHWYRHIPSKAPEWILFISTGQPSYSESSYRTKYNSLKKSPNICGFSINNINSNDEGTYYCAVWQYHGTKRAQTACTENCLFS